MEEYATPPHPRFIIGKPPPFIQRTKHGCRATIWNLQVTMAQRLRTRGTVAPRTYYRFKSWLKDRLLFFQARNSYKQCLTKYAPTPMKKSFVSVRNMHTNQLTVVTGIIAFSCTNQKKPINKV